MFDNMAGTEINPPATRSRGSLVHRSACPAALEIQAGPARIMFQDKDCAGSACRCAWAWTPGQVFYNFLLTDLRVLRIFFKSTLSAFIVAPCEAAFFFNFFSTFFCRFRAVRSAFSRRSTFFKTCWAAATLDAGGVLDLVAFLDEAVALVAERFEVAVRDRDPDPGFVVLDDAFTGLR